MRKIDRLAPARSVRGLLLAAALWLGLAACAAPTAPAAPAPPATAAPAPAPPALAPPRGASLLHKVRARGALHCGVDEDLPGFSSRSPGGAQAFAGFNADFCRVVAVAIFGEAAGRVVYFPLSFDERYTALVTGKVDLLFGNTPWVASVDAELPLEFGPTIFYDSLAVMAPRRLGIARWEDLPALGRGDRTACVERGGFPATRVEGEDAPPAPEVVDLFAENGVGLRVVPLRSDDYSYQAYRDGECDVVIGLQSRLTSRRSAFGPARDAHVIVPAAFAVDGQRLPRLVREPLGPVFVEGDSQWRDVVSWAVYATIQAEEYGIGRDNVEDFLGRPERSYRVFLGQEGDLGRSLGLRPDFAYRIVREVGSYVEIYRDNLGAILPERGPNKAWNRADDPAGEVLGGVLSSPPFR